MVTHICAQLGGNLLAQTVGQQEVVTKIGPQKETDSPSQKAGRSVHDKLIWLQTTSIDVC